MFDAVVPGLVLAYAVLASIYWICLIVGGGLLALSVLSAADSDADVDFDADADVDLGANVETDAGWDAADTQVDAADAAHAGMTALSAWLSMRFIVFFLAVFGAVGVTLSLLTELGRPTVFAISLAIGFVVGQAAHQIVRFITRSSGNTAPRPSDYVNRLARVTIAISHPHKGEIVLQVRNAERHVAAIGGGEDQDFQTGDEVVVAGYRAGVARVVSKAEYERRGGSA